MGLNLQDISPEARAAYIKVGERFGSEDTLDQATQTLNAYTLHGVKLNDYGFTADDAQELEDARDALSRAGVGREAKRANKKVDTAALSTAMHDGQNTRLHARSILNASKQGLLALGNIGAVQKMETLLDRESAVAEDAEGLAKQLDALQSALKDSAIADAAKNCGGPKVVLALETNAQALRASAKAKAEPRGTPVETETLDLIDGIIVNLARSAREAAEAASRDLAEPAMATAFELSALYKRREVLFDSALQSCSAGTSTNSKPVRRRAYFMRDGEIVADRFMVECLAGSGGMGEVYRAMDRKTEAPVAIKVLLAERHGDLDRFEREARILASIVHPRVVSYVTHGVLSSGDPYLVMEWLDGHDLSAKLERGAIDEVDAIAIASGAAEALGALHELGIVHRDLKPSNLFLVGGRTDRVKLLDLGIARSNAASKLTSTDMVLGTASYMSPEQATGGKAVDARADIFSLGCVMYECLTGEKAFDGAHIMAILTKILFHEPPRLWEKRRDLSASLCALVDRMLSKGPEKRPANGNAVFEALHGIGNVDSNQFGETVQTSRIASLTQSEQRAVALIFIGFSDTIGSNEQLSFEAAKYGGRLERLFDGSAVVLLSGTVVATDLAAQAARCALALKRQAYRRRIALTMRRSEETGRIQVGQAIDRAAQLLDGLSAEQDANDHVMLDDVTVGLLDARFDVLADSGIFVLRAERQVTEVRTLMGKPTPCVGRDRELRQIEESFNDCVNDSQARAILLTGPAGMGKSRIGREIVQRLRAHESPPAIWMARGELLGAGSALSMLAELLRGACGIRVGEPLDVRRDKLRHSVNTHVPVSHQKQVTEFLGEIVGAHFPDEDNIQLRAARQDAQIMSDQIRAAFIEFLRAACEAGPVFLLLDDLHWGDSATVKILGSALGELADKPFFLLALGRPEVDDLFPWLLASRRLETKRVLQLGKNASEQLIKHVLGARAGADTIERIVRLADGNAFYLEELIRATAEGKGVHLPETVVAMVQSRLTELSDVERRILRAASVFGETFWAGGVATLLGDRTALRHSANAIRSLVDAELVTKKRESRFVGEDEYAFRHALVREGAYVMLTEDDKTLGHRLAGQWLEQHGESDALVLAEHFQKGGEGEKAAGFFLRVAEVATVAGDSATAVMCAKQGLDCGPSEDVRLRILGMICEASAWLSTVGTSDPGYAEELLRSSSPASKPWMQGFFRNRLADFYGFALSAEQKSAIANGLCNITPAADAVRLFVWIAGTSAIGLVLHSDFVNSDTLTKKIHDISIEYQADVPVPALYHLLLASKIIQSGRGNAWDSLHHAQACRTLFKIIPHRRMDALARIYYWASTWLLTADDGPIAELAHPQLPDKELALTADVRNIVLIWHYMNLGNLVQARQIAEAYGAFIRETRVRRSRGHWLLAEVLRRQGEFEHAGHEIALAQSMAFPIDQPGICATLAALRLAEGNIVDAVSAAETGMRLYETMGACSFSRAGFLRVVHAECLHAAGRLVDAKHAIHNAKQWLMDMAEGIGDENYRKSFLENVPENRRILELAAEWENVTA